MLSGCGALDSGTGRAQDATAAAPAATVAPSTSQAANGPVTAPPDVVHPKWKVPPRSGLLFDLDSGEILWSRKPDRRRPIASITKMMTALLVVERLPEGSKVKVTKEALKYQGSGVGVLPKGRRVGLQAMLYGLMLASGNDAAIALSQRVSGTLKGFVSQMNAKARAMHLGCTRFTRPDGFEDKGNYSCAYDLAALAKVVLANRRLRRIVRRRAVVLPFPVKGGKLYLYNHNPLLKTGYRGTIGVKTGFTDAAGHSLVAAVRRNGHTLGVVLLHSPNINKQARKLFGLAFSLPRYR